MTSTVTVAGGLGPSPKVFHKLSTEMKLDSDWTSASLVSGPASTRTANAVNNLPALLLALDALDATRVSPAIWDLLLGVNVGPVVLVTGSPSGVLWLDATRREGVDVGPGSYARVGIAVGVPSFAAAVAVLLALA